MSRGLDRARGHLAAAAAELEAAVVAWGLWADEVRERAERRLGAGPGDLRVWGDPEYARALDAGGPFIEAARVAATALEPGRRAAAVRWSGAMRKPPGFTSFLYVMSGAKTWASGAGLVSRPIVTATFPQGGVQMCVVPLDRVDVAIDASGWNPLGMHESDSFVVSFQGAHLSEDDLLGGIGDYERSPWFRGGALRFVAVHTGIVERLFDETVRYLVDRQARSGSTTTGTYRRHADRSSVGRSMAQGRCGSVGDL